MNNTAPEDMSGKQWAGIKPLLPPQKPRRRPNKGPSTGEQQHIVDSAAEGTVKSLVSNSTWYSRV